MELTPKHYIEKAKEGPLSEWLRDFVMCRVKIIFIDKAVRPFQACPPRCDMPPTPSQARCPLRADVPPQARALLNLFTVLK